MIETVKIYREIMPAARLIGKCYPEAKRVAAQYTTHWEEWFIKDWFAPLQKLPRLKTEGDAYIGSMRYGEEGLEYWIGMLLQADAPVPDGYEFLDIAGGEIGVIWLKGPDDWDLYRQHEASVAAFRAQGWKVADKADFFERYTQTRFAIPDEQGNVILDYCVHLGE